MAWTSSSLGVSVDGAAFTRVGNTSIPSLTATLVDIGTGGATNHFNGDILWFAMGTGSFTDADAARLFANGDIDPTTA
jgi:hypothetical protein